MKHFELLNVIVAIVILAGAASATPVHLRCEYLENPLGLDVASPHLSWQSDSTERNWKQGAYEILVASNDENLRTGKADIWDSGKVDSAESVGIAYRGPALESQKEILLESSGTGMRRDKVSEPGRSSLVGDRADSSWGLEGKVDSLEESRR